MITNSTTEDKEDIFNKNFSIEELKEAVKGLQCKKIPGTDKIMYEFMKHLGGKALNAILNLFNLIWKMGVPDSWRKAIIIPILKPNKDPAEVDSYRPIALTSILAKTMEKMIHARLNWFLEKQQLITPVQAGFRKFHSTTQQVAMLSQEMKDALDNSKSTLAVFIDFKSAYDSIWRQKLLQKMMSLGIEGSVLSWFQSFLIQIFICTRYNQNYSKFKQIHHGLPQGSVLSTILFNIMINDLPQKLLQTKNINCALFADDLVIWTSAKNKDESKLSREMNKALEDLSIWCEENLMTINPEKSYFQVFTLKPKVPQIQISLKNTLRQETNEAKYLGIYLEKKLTWKTHTEKTSESAEND